MSPLVVGVGCQRGAAERALLEALGGVLADARLLLERVVIVVTGERKRGEPAIRALAEVLGAELRYLADHELVRRADEAAHALAEPAARALARGPVLVARTTRRDPVSGHAMAFAVAAREAAP